MNIKFVARAVGALAFVVSQKKLWFVRLYWADLVDNYGNKGMVKERLTRVSYSGGLFEISILVINK